MNVDQILTTSLNDYITYTKETGKPMTHFEIKGVHMIKEYFDPYHNNYHKACLIEFCKLAPEGTIAIVDYKENLSPIVSKSSSDMMISCHGTAIVSKSSEEYEQQDHNLDFERILKKAKDLNDRLNES